LIHTNVSLDFLAPSLANFSSGLPSIKADELANSNVGREAKAWIGLDRQVKTANYGP